MCGAFWLAPWEDDFDWDSTEAIPAQIIDAGAE